MPFYYPQAVIKLRVRWEEFDRTTDKLLTQVHKVNCLAKRISININDYTQADTFECELDYRHFPFDPRCIRAMGITIHLEDRKKLFEKNGSPSLIRPTSANTIFQGFADQETITFDESTRHIRFEGRDFTSLLIDSAWTGKIIEPSRRLDLIIQDMLNSLPSTTAIEVDNRTGETLPTIKQYAPSYDPMAGNLNGGKNKSYWDVIKDLVSRAALICWIELDKLVISKPRALYSDTNVHHFIYGKNLNNLTIKRKIGRQKGINVLVRTLIPENSPPVETVKIPLEASASWSNSVGVAREEQKIQKMGSDGKLQEETAPYLSFMLPDIANKSILRSKGEAIWEELGRQQLEGSLETRDMAAYQKVTPTSKDKKLFDYTKIRNGTPIKIEIDQGDLEGLRRIETESGRTQFLMRNGYKDKIARALSRTLGKFSTRFYTKAVEYTVDKDQGFAMNLDFINFIELDNKTL